MVVIIGAGLENSSSVGREARMILGIDLQSDCVADVLGGTALRALSPKPYALAQGCRARTLRGLISKMRGKPNEHLVVLDLLGPDGADTEKRNGNHSRTHAVCSIGENIRFTTNKITARGISRIDGICIQLTPHRFVWNAG